MVTCGCMCKVCLADVCVCVPFIIAEALHSVTPQVRLVTCGHMCKVKCGRTCMVTCGCMCKVCLADVCVCL